MRSKELNRDITLYSELGVDGKKISIDYGRGPHGMCIGMNYSDAIVMAQWILETIGGVQEGEARAEESVPLVPSPAAGPITETEE